MMEIIENIIFTLERVSVRGKDDMSRMLGVIQALENLKKELAINEQSAHYAVQQREEADSADTVRRV